MPLIFKYLIGAKEVEVRLACRFDWHDSIVIYTMPYFSSILITSFYSTEYLKNTIL